MYCTKCGAENNGGKFCPRCGAAQTKADVIKQETAPVVPPEPVAPESVAPPVKQPEQVSEADSDTYSVKKAPAARKKRKIILIGAAAMLVILGVVTAVFVYYNTGERLAKKQMSLGEKYLSEMNYGEAVTAFNKAVDVDPGNADAYVGLAEAYTGMQEPEKAAEALDTGLWQVPDSGIIKAKLFDSLIALGGMFFDEKQYDEALEAYQDAAELSPANEDALLGIEYARIGMGDPGANNAELSLVTTDLSDYPYVRVYCRILDTSTGESISNLTAASFALEEKIEGGAYLSREVHSVRQLEGNAGLNIALAADKSDSISYDSMTQIKQVMSEFVSNLDYTVGDEAELLAFDTEVTQMCIFTDDISRLLTGIENMYTDGRTALYDALREAINHVRFQNGAQCVIAFTDGLDNESMYSPYDVIELASRYEVPVYIIGVGSDVDEYTLRDIAEQTGGQYWNINELQDMNEIYNTIYKEQKEMYIIEYKTDASADEYADRGLSVSFKGAGYMEECLVGFTPKASNIDDTDLSLQASQTSTTRYQLFVSNLSWEEAADYCMALGGHLVTIDSADEEGIIESMAEQAGVTFVWLGGYTSYNDAGSMFGHWVTGEPFGYTNWTTGEPSKDDLDGTAERYIVLWYLKAYGGWAWNDTRNDPVSAGHYKDKLAFVCEFES